MNDYCKDCIFYPCGEIEDDDTEIFDCAYKETSLIQGGDK